MVRGPKGKGISKEHTWVIHFFQLSRDFFKGRGHKRESFAIFVGQRQASGYLESIHESLSLDWVRIRLCPLWGC